MPNLPHDDDPRPDEPTPAPSPGGPVPPRLLSDLGLLLARYERANVRRRQAMGRATARRQREELRAYAESHGYLVLPDDDDEEADDGR